MSEGLKQYNALLAQIKAAKGYAPGMGEGGKALLAQCRREASVQHAASQGKPVPAPKAAKPRAPAQPRAKFSLDDKRIRPCAGLIQNSCEVSPHCFWQPKAKRCMTRSGKDAVTTFNNPPRKAMLDSLRKQQQPQQQQQGGYWY